MIFVPSSATCPSFRQPGFFRQLQHLQKQPPQRRQMTLPEVGDRAKIWRVVRHDHHEIDPLGACLRDPPRGIKTRAIGIEQQGRHHARIERRLTKPAFVACDDLRQIQVLARQSDDELRQMVRRHIIDDRRRQELCLINCPRTKMSAHASKGRNRTLGPKLPPLLGHAPSGRDGCVVHPHPWERPSDICWPDRIDVSRCGRYAAAHCGAFEDYITGRGRQRCH